MGRECSKTPRRYHADPPPRVSRPSDTGFIEDLIAAAIDVLFSPFEAIFAPLIDPLVDLIGLPDIGFGISVSFDGRMDANARAI